MARDVSEAPARLPLSKRVRFGWVLEAVAVRGLMSVYDWSRDALVGSEHEAFRHAKQVIRAERVVGIYHEESIQEVFLGWEPFISFWNVFYGSVHFVVPLVALVWLYVKAPTRYLRWRNTAFVMMGIGLLGFWLYPLMPPRLLPESYGFVDTRLEFFGLGEASRTTADDNLYAAMPSLHIGWATWVAIALWPLVRRPWAHALLVAYPAAQLFCTVVTANHFFLDALGGWAALGAAYGIASAPAWWRGRRRPGAATISAAERDRAP